MKRILILCTLLLLTACASVRVNYDYERNVDWAGYRTYAFYPGMETGLTELDTRRLLAAVEEVLRERGYGQSEEPDFTINIFSESYREAPGSSVGVGLGGTGGNVGGGVSVGIPVSSNGLKRRITFDLIDTNKDQLIWQAVSTDSFREEDNPLKREERLAAVARKVFGSFPPGR